jgi:phage terminase large subunit-like protein
MTQSAISTANLPPSFLNLSADELDEYATQLEKHLEALKAITRLEDYRPYSKQRAFHAAGEAARERLLMAANQVGKTWSAGMEVAMHATGIYPDWWQGRRWDRPITAWCAGITGESTRDNVQRILMGRPNAYGTGAIPKAQIAEYSSSRGIPDLLDTIQVKHVSGGVSTVALKSYEKGREKWQGETLDIVWFDEEPPADIYIEGLTRTNATVGIVFMTFTPLLGMSDVVRRFLMEKPPGTSVTTMTIDDAEHYSPEQRAAIIASYPAHERDARVKGIPSLGSGRVFPSPARLSRFSHSRSQTTGRSCAGSISAGTTQALQCELRGIETATRCTSWRRTAPENRRRPCSPPRSSRGATGCRGRGRTTACSTTRAQVSS